MPPSISDQTDALEKPSRTITRRRGACKGCKLKKIRCNGGTPCAACDRIGLVCNYEPRRREASSRGELDLPTSDRPYSSPRSIQSEGLGNTSGPKTSLLADNSWSMFSLDMDVDVDFRFSPETIPFPNTSEAQNLVQTAFPSEHHVINTAPGSQHPVANFSIPSTLALEVGEFGDGRNADSTHALSLPMLRRPTIYTVDNGLPDYCPVGAEIDFAFITSLGLAKLPIRSQDSNKHREICQILESLTSDVQTKTPPSSNPKDGTKSVRLLWESQDDRTIQRCIEACFERSPEVQMFLRKADADKCLSEARESSHTAILASLFSDAIVAIGLDVLRNPIGVGKGSSLSDTEHLRSVLDASFAFGLNAVCDSLLKLQTAVLLSVIASSINDSRLRNILRIGVDCARELRFTDSHIIRKTIKHADDQKLIQRTVWVLYCLEINYSVHRGIAPSFYSDFIDHLPTTSDHLENHDLLALQTAAAALLERSVSRVYRQKTSTTTAMELQACVSALGQWRHCLPDHIEQLIVGQRFESLHEDKNSSAKLRLFCYYHECVFLIFGPWLSPLLESMPPVSSREVLNMKTPESTADRGFALGDTIERCLESAHTIVSHTYEILAVDKTLAKRLYSLMVISTCIITYGIQYGDSDVRKRSLAHLGICCGTFARMSEADSSLPFEKILDLVRIIRSDN
ncbi:hypothetical protein HD806DRAFT_416008 [Xylariaceae sp. AK1471]|nr:hypothetical protein HD806DRAFT_416008 [Xylariaceae sp. AK1471]